MTMSDSADPGFLAPDESRLTRLGCPECGGALAQIDLSQIAYFRCHIGHQYAPQTLAAAQADATESKLWSALAALEEQATTLRFLESLPGAAAADDRPVAADELSERADTLRQQLHSWKFSLPMETDQPVPST